MGNQRLTLDEAKRLLLAEGSAAQIAADFGVSSQTVRLYKNLSVGMARDAAEALALFGQEVTPLPDAATLRFSQTDIAEIRASQASSSDEAERWGCSASMIRMIRTGGAYARD